MRLHNTSMMTDFPYLYRGIVLDNQDPKNLGRCKVVVPSIHRRDVPASYLPWSRSLSTKYQSSDRGNFVVPEVGDTVWVLFEGGDKDSPVYIGGARTTKDILVSTDIVLFYQNGKDKILYDKRNHKIEIISQGEVRIDSPSIILGGDVKVDGDLTVNGDIVLKGKLIE